jgi:hypothetical protein
MKSSVKNILPSLIDLKLGGDICVSTRSSAVCLFTICKHKQTKHTSWLSQLSESQIVLGSCFDASVNNNNLSYYDDQKQLNLFHLERKTQNHPW